MPEYILNRNHTLAGQGHVINFKKGEPIWVPPSLVREAVSIGAEPLEGERPDPLGPEAAGAPVVPQGAERKEAIYAAFDLLIEKNDSKDFGADGKPAVVTMEKILGFDITKKERDASWLQYHADKAA